MRWSFGFGPFRVYGGKSAASRRATARRKAKDRAANARERAKRAEARAWRNSPKGRAYHQQALAELAELNRQRALTSTGPVLVTRVVPYKNFSNANIYVKGDPSLLPENPLATVSLSIPGFEHVVPGNVVSFDLEITRPRAVHLIERGEDHAYRASVSGCRIDPLTGGAFILTAPGHPDLHLEVPSDMAMRFMSLRNRDVVLVVLSPDGQGVEAFWHLARATGAEPRNPADFPEGFTRG
jgi:hypothetical protein